MVVERRVYRHRIPDVDPRGLRAEKEQTMKWESDTNDDLTAAVARLRDFANHFHTRQSLDIALVLSALEAAQADARRWDMLCRLWAHATEMALTQDEDGRWSISMVEPVESITFSRITGDDPDAAIDAAMGDSDA